MKLLDERDMSLWAYSECLKGNDTPEIRNLITNHFCLYSYCVMIKDREEMWSKITHPVWAKAYCIDVKERPRVLKYVKDY